MYILRTAATALTIAVVTIITPISPFIQVAAITTIAEPTKNTIINYLSKATIANENVVKGIFDTNSTPFGLTYGDWTAIWWQWAYSIPKNINPAYDDTGKYCTENQNGPVWFFPGTYGKPVVRQCTIPEGKAILFPILNSECSFAEFPKLKTIEELHTCAKTFQDQVTQLEASVDGVSIPESELKRYRIQSPPFNFTLPQDNILGLPSNTTTRAVADGNWVFLQPLSVGEHEINFKGGTSDFHPTSTYANATVAPTVINNSNFAFPTGWDYETTYRITVTAK